MPLPSPVCLAVAVAASLAIAQAQDAPAFLDVSLDSKPASVDSGAALVVTAKVGWRSGGSGEKVWTRRGDAVEARYKGSRHHYPGRIARDNGDGTYDVKFNDGDRDRAVPVAPRLPPPAPPARRPSGEHLVDMLERMEAEQRRLEAGQAHVAQEAAAAAAEQQRRGVIARSRRIAGRAHDFAARTGITTALSVAAGVALRVLL